MEIYISPNWLLSCCVDCNNTYSVEHKDLERFVTILQRKLAEYPGELEDRDLYVDYPTGTRTYYNDIWRNDFYFFRGKYYFESPFRQKREDIVKNTLSFLEKHIPKNILEASIDKFKQEMQSIG